MHDDHHADLGPGTGRHGAVSGPGTPTLPARRSFTGISTDRAATSSRMAPATAGVFPTATPTATAGTTRPLPSPGRQPHRGLLLPALFRGPTRAGVPGHVLQSVREPGPALPAVHRQRGLSSHGRAAARFGHHIPAAVQHLVQFRPRHPRPASSRPSRGPLGKLGQDRPDSLTVPLRPSLHDRCASPCGHCPPHRSSHSG